MQIDPKIVGPFPVPLEKVRFYPIIFVRPRILKRSFMDSAAEFLAPWKHCQKTEMNH
jgi:hypothetical protein